MEHSELQLIAIKAESTYGTDPVPTVAANLIPAAGPIDYKLETTAVERKIMDGTLDSLPGLNALPNVTVKFAYELRGNRKNGTTQLDISNGTSTQAIELDALLKAANLDAAYTAAGTPGTEGSVAGSRDGYVIYKPKSFTTQGPSVTVYWWSGLKLHKLIGGKVDIEVVAEAGKLVVCNVTIRGKYVAVSDATLSIAGATWLDVKPPQFLPTTLTIGSYTPVLSMLKFGLGNDIQMREDALQTDGVAGFIIGGYKPKGEVNPESVTAAAHGLWADLLASTVRTLTAINGADGGNKFTFTHTVEFKGANYADKNKARVHSASFDIVKSALGGAEGSQFQLKFF